MIKSLLKSIVPKSIKCIINNIYNKSIYDVKFGNNAYAKRTVFEGKNFVNDQSEIYDSHIGFGTYISGDNILKKIKIGKFCSIGQNIRNQFSSHPSSTFVSTHPAFFSLKKQSGFTFTSNQLFPEEKYVHDNNGQPFLSIIENDVWIGNDVKILEGIRIGSGSIIGTGSVVTKDIEPYSIVAGVPAKHIRYRFEKEQIDFLLKYKWWNKDFKWLKNNYKLFNNIHNFHIQKANENKEI